MDILVDFDGTCVAHAFPNIGKEIGAVPVLLELVKNEHNLILFTMRSNFKDKKDPTKINYYLDEAIDWFDRNGIELYGIQRHPTQHFWTSSPKAYGQLIIDDTAAFAPLKFDKEKSNRPFIDWEIMAMELQRLNLI